MKLKWVACFALSVVMTLGGASYATSAKTEFARGANIQKMKKVAVFPFLDDVLGFGHAVSDALSAELMAMGFDVIERARLNSLLEEMKLNKNGVVSEDMVAELGKLLNVDAVVFGSMSSNLAGGVYSVSLRFVEVNTGDVLMSSSYFSASGKKIGSAMDDIVDSISRKLFLKKLPSRGQFVLANNQNVARKTYKKVAMLPLSGPESYGESSALYGALVTDLLGVKVGLVERKDLNKILEEQKRYASGLYEQVADNVSPSGKEVSGSTYTLRELRLSNKELERIGALTGADGLIVGSFSAIYTEWPFLLNVVNLRLLDIQTGRVAWAVTYYRGGQGYSTDLPDITEMLAANIAPAIRTNTHEGFREVSAEIYKQIGKHESSVRFQVTDYQAD